MELDPASQIKIVPNRIIVRILEIKRPEKWSGNVILGILLSASLLSLRFALEDMLIYA
jgi:hypothetical protein